MKSIYTVQRLQIGYAKERPSSWKFAGTTVRGKEYHYQIKDTNYSRYNQWTLIVRVPKNVYGNIVVQPAIKPSKKVWAALERRSIVLTRATKRRYKRYVYCKGNLADPTGEQTKIGTRRGDRNSLPKWFQPFLWRMRLKQTVTTTRGTDAQAQVIFISRDDHRTMLQLYFALKVWVLEEGFTIE